MPSRYDWIPKARWAWQGAAIRGLDADLAAIETNGAPALPGQASIAVQSTPDGGVTWQWSLTPAQAAAVHAAGGVIEWVTRSGGPLPSQADGRTALDIVNGVMLMVASIPPTSAPAASDVDGTAQDTVTLTKTLGVTWNVNGVAHKSSEMAGATKVVPYTLGTNTTVTATPEDGYWIDDQSVTSYPLVFTPTYTAAYTSESFRRAPGVLPLGAFTTSADLGGVQRTGTLSKAASITAGGALEFTQASTDLIIPVTGVTSASLIFTITKLAAQGLGALSVNVARKSDGNASLGAGFETNGARWSVYQVGGALTDTNSGTVQVGDTWRVDAVTGASINTGTGALTPAAGNTSLALYRNGVFVKGVTATGTLPFDGFRIACTAGTSFPGVKDVVYRSPAAVTI